MRREGRDAAVVVALLSVFWRVLEERSAVLVALELLFLHCVVGCVK